MKEPDEMTHKYANDCIKRLSICIHEHLIPHYMQKDFNKDLEDIKDNFSIIEAFDCMKFDIDTVAMIIELHDTLIENPLIFVSKYQLEYLLKEFILYSKGFECEMNDCCESDYEELVESDEQIIKDFIKKKYDK